MNRMMEPWVKNSLYEELDHGQRPCTLTNNKYIPLDIVYSTITVQSMKATLRPTWWFPWLPCRNSILDSRIQQARKVIAILVLIDKKLDIEDLLCDELTDGDLPLSQQTNPRCAALR